MALSSFHQSQLLFPKPDYSRQRCTSAQNWGVSDLSLCRQSLLRPRHLPPSFVTKARSSSLSAALGDEGSSARRLEEVDTPSLVAEKSALSVEEGLSKNEKSTPSDLQSELRAAIAAVERACQLCINVRAGIHDDGELDEGDARLKKQDATPVTVADFGVQALISMDLRRHFPDVPMLGEEDATELRQQLDTQPAPSASLAEAVATAVATVAPADLGPITVERVLDSIDDGRAETTSQERYWILDPIDGTRGFLRGGEAQYVIALALVSKGEVVLGVCGCPNMSAASFAGNTCTTKGPVGERDSGGNAGKRRAESGCFEKQGPLGENRRGIIVYASQGQGTWVRGLKPPDDAAAPSDATTSADLDTSHGTSEGDEPRPRVASRVKVDGVKRLWDARFCISDHERWGDLPLAAALASTPHPEDSDDEAGCLHQADDWEGKQLPLCCGSICKYIAVALGAASVFVQHPVAKPALKVWDHAAALICVLEAGGRVTDFDGRPLRLGTGESLFQPGGGGVIVTNGKLHGETLAAVQKGQLLLAG